MSARLCLSEGLVSFAALVVVCALGACDDASVAGPSGGGGDDPGGGGSAGVGAMQTSAGTGAKATPFEEKCMSCHGADGSGVAGKGPEIWHPNPEVARYLVRSGDDNTTLNGKGEIVGPKEKMTATPSTELSNMELNDILAWLSAKPKPTTGAELFADHCAYCHGASGKGGDTEYVSPYHSAPFSQSGNVPTSAAFLQYVRKGHVVDDEGKTIQPSQRREFMPPFPPEMLTDAELQLIETWARAQ